MDLDELSAMLCKALTSRCSMLVTAGQPHEIASAWASTQLTSQVVQAEALASGWARTQLTAQLS